MTTYQLTNTVAVYRYSDVIFKYMPEEALETVEDSISYNKKKFYYQVIETEDFSIQIMLMTQLTKI